MEFNEVIRRRRMVRNYTEDPVSDAQIERILEAARRAPSAGFSQGQSFVVITDAQTRSRVARLAGEELYTSKGFDPWISRAPVLVVVCTSEQVYRRRYDEPDKRSAGKPAIDWPVPYWFVDAGCSMMLLLLAAVDEGVGALFFAISWGEEAVLADLGVPAGFRPIGAVALGHPAGDDRPSSSLARGRRPVDQVVHRGGW